MRSIAKAAAVLATAIMVMAATAATGAGAQGAGHGERAASGFGVTTIDGREVLVEVVVVVPPGASPEQAVDDELRARGAHPIDVAALGSEGFELTGFEWEPAEIPDETGQHYFDAEEPAGVDGATALQNSHSTWNGVSTSMFQMDYAGTTTRCPSLVRECPGPQETDGFNDLGWVQLRPGVLGVAYLSDDDSGSDEEVDIALTTRVDWTSDYDAETVMLHENGHFLGLGHSSFQEAVMYDTYQGQDRDLHFDDEEGATFLYDGDVQGLVTGTVEDSNGDPISGATVELVDAGLSDTTGDESGESAGEYTIEGVPDPVTYDVRASHPDYETATKTREHVDGTTTVNFTLTSGNGGGDDGFCPPGHQKQGRC